MKEVGKMDCHMDLELRSIQTGIHILEISKMGIKMDRMGYLYGVAIPNSFSIRVVSKMERYLVREFFYFEIKQKYKVYSKIIISVIVFFKILSTVS